MSFFQSISSVGDAPSRSAGTSSRRLETDNVPAASVLTREEAVAVLQKILSYSRADTAQVRLTHSTVGVTRFNRRRQNLSRNSETLKIELAAQFGTAAGVVLTVNQLDDAVLKTIVPYLESIARHRLGQSDRVAPPKVVIGPQEFLPVQLWHDDTVDALTEQRTAVLPSILAAARANSLSCAVYACASAQAYCAANKDGLVAYSRTTDAEVTVTCWTADGIGSGWGGSAARDWAKIDYMGATEQAVELAKRSARVDAVEPGRRTAILGPAAVAQLVRGMTSAFDANLTRSQRSPLSKPPAGSKLGEQVLDRRLSLTSDPNDPAGGYRPFFWSLDRIDVFDGMPQQVMPWIEKGVLRRLAYSPGEAAEHGIADAAEIPWSLRLEGESDAHTTVDEMISRCEEGIYVNRFSSLQTIDLKAGVTSGVTRDGCFLVRHGKLDRAIKNFRFIDSPWLALNRLEMVGAAGRAALGYTPSFTLAWPLPPVIVPPVMVRDFNFAALADAI